MDVYAATRESLALLRRGQLHAVLDRCVPVLDVNPTYLPLRLIMCQALIALDRDREAEAHLCYCTDLDPECGTAYRHLGEIALRRNQPEAAARLLDEACRLTPADQEARDLLATLRRPSSGGAETPSHRDSVASAPGRSRLARGTDRPPAQRSPSSRAAGRPAAAGRVLARGSESASSRSRQRTTLRDAFGDYLADTGILSRAQVRAALIYRRTRGGSLGDAALALGFVSELKLQWATQSYQASRGSGDRCAD